MRRDHFEIGFSREEDVDKNGGDLDIGVARKRPRLSDVELCRGKASYRGEERGCDEHEVSRASQSLASISMTRFYMYRETS